MALHLTPDHGDPGEPRVKDRPHGGAEAGEERRLIRDGAQVLAHGALVCPECELPMFPAGRVRAALEVTCSFCEHTAEARDFIREDVYDTVANEVYLVARIA